MQIFLKCLKKLILNLFSSKIGYLKTKKNAYASLYAYAFPFKMLRFERSSYCLSRYALKSAKSFVISMLCLVPFMNSWSRVGMSMLVERISSTFSLNFAG